MTGRFATILSIVVVLVSGRVIPHRGIAYTASLVAVLCAGLCWLAAAREIWRDRWRPRLGESLVWVALLLVAALTLGPAMSDDVHRYVFEGRMLSGGYNPYLHAPADPAVMHLRDGDWELINNKQIPAAYPPAVQFASAIGAVLGGVAGLGVRVVFSVCHLAAFVALWRLLGSVGLPSSRALLYGLCPMLALEFGAEGHSDSVAVAALLAALLCARRRWAVSTGVALGIAVAGKLIPIVLLPFLLRVVPRRRALVFGFLATVGLSWGPFLWSGGLEIFTGTLQYVTRWRGNDSMFAVVYAATEWAQAQGLLGEVEVQRASKVPIAVIGCLVLWLAWLRRATPERAALWFFTYFIAFAPTVHPWYVAFLVPFLCFRPRVGVLAFVGGSVFLAYHVLPGWIVQRRWVEVGWIRFVEYAPFYTAIYFAWRGDASSEPWARLRKNSQSARLSSSST